jgi:hypothetical protein
VATALPPPSGNKLAKPWVSDRVERKSTAVPASRSAAAYPSCSGDIPAGRGVATESDGCRRGDFKPTTTDPTTCAALHRTNRPAEDTVSGVASAPSKIE